MLYRYGIQGITTGELRLCCCKSFVRSGSSELKMTFTTTMLLHKNMIFLVLLQKLLLLFCTTNISYTSRLIITLVGSLVVEIRSNVV